MEIINIVRNPSRMAYFLSFAELKTGTKNERVNTLFYWSLYDQAQKDKNEPKEIYSKAPSILRYNFEKTCDLDPGN